jgi:hypothetical protein
MQARLTALVMVVDFASLDALGPRDHKAYLRTLLDPHGLFIVGRWAELPQMTMPSRFRAVYVSNAKSPPGTTTSWQAFVTA